MGTTPGCVLLLGLLAGVGQEQDPPRDRFILRQGALIAAATAREYGQRFGLRAALVAAPVRPDAAASLSLRGALVPKLGEGGCSTATDLVFANGFES